MIDVDIAPTWTQVCPGSDEPLVELFTETAATPSEDSGNFWWSWTGGDAHDPLHYIFLDLGAGQTAMIVIDSANPADEAAFVAKAMRVIQTFMFGPG